MKKISVLIPFLEETEWLRKNVEILSGDSRIEEFVYEIGTRPVGKARQNLLEKAKTEYLLWLDADIELIENPIDRLLEHIDKDNIAGVSCFIMDTGEKNYPYDKIERYLLPEIYPKRQYHFNCVLYKREYLIRAGGFDTESSFGEDHDMQVKLNQNGYDIICLKDVVVKHHIIKDFSKEKKYFQGYKYLFNKYGFCEYEADLVNLSSLKARMVMLKIDSKFFLKKCFNFVLKKIKGLINLLNGFFKSLIFRLTPEMFGPYVSGLLVTENCVFRCKSCIYWEKPQKDLPLNKIYEIIDKFVDFGISEVFLIGGEPMMRDDFGLIVDHLKKKKVKSAVITNGYFGKKWLEKLLDLDRIIISINGMRQVHDDLCGIPSWDRAVDLLFELKRKYNKNVEVYFVLQKDNYKDLPIIASFLKKIGIRLEILCYSTRGMGQPEIDNRWNYENELNEVINNPGRDLYYPGEIEYLKLIKSKFSKKFKRQKCIVPNFKLLVDAKGGVYPCSAWSKPVANILEVKDFKDIWNSYKPLRKKIREGSCDYCINCRSCELKINFNPGFNYFKKLLKKLHK